MRILLFALLLLTGYHASIAQSSLYDAGLMLNAGIGTSTRGFPVYAGVEKGLGKDFSFGLELSARERFQEIAGLRDDYTVYGAAAFVNYYLNYALRMDPDLDLYVGLNSGYIVWDDPRDDKSWKRDLAAGFHFGGRYFLSHTFALQLEFGTGTAFSAGKLGISVVL